MIAELAGAVGVDPGPFTLRELFWMAEGHDRHEWGRASSLMAMIANAHKGKKGRWVRPAQLNPYERDRPPGIPLTTDNIRILKSLVPNGKTVRTKPGRLSVKGQKPCEKPPPS